MIDRPLSWLYTRRLWGARCLDYDPGCACCEAWATHDWLFNDGFDPEQMSRLSRLADGVESGEIKTVKLAGLSDEQILRAFEYDGDIRCRSDQGRTPSRGF